MIGRARRLKLIKIIGIAIIGVVGAFLLGRAIISILIVKDDNVEYAYLKKYLKGKGFVCESLKASGGTCKNRTEGVYELFVRYDNGFDYIYNNDKYSIHLYHAGGKEKFAFTTGDDAFKGYKNLKYKCSYKESIVNELDKCVLEEDDTVALDNKAYIGIINNTMFEVRKILAASGYDVDTLIDKYEWKKK
jgi:hypothetical protein